MTSSSNQKVAIDLLISILATFLLSTCILSVSTSNWHITRNSTSNNRTGLFQQCHNTCCCGTKELDRSITMLALFSVILLATGTLASFLLMATTMDTRTRCYVLVPLTLFGAGIAMTLTLIQILDRLNLNGYSGFIFIIDTVLAYVLGGISLLHANMFYL